MTCPCFRFLAVVILLLTVDTEASRELDEKCTNRTSFTFDDGDLWNTTNTGWTLKRSTFGSNRYMALNFNQFRNNERITRAFVESPLLCSPQNGTYRLRFKFAIPGISHPSCYLEVGVQTAALHRYKTLWRSSGSTWNLFTSVSPPLTFRMCSSDFRVVFVGVKVKPGPCVLLFDTIYFDDVVVSYVSDSHDANWKLMCQGDGPDPDKGGGRSGQTVIRVLVITLGVVFVVAVIVIAVLAVMAVKARRRRSEVGLRGESNNSYNSVGYQTFTNGAAAYTKEYGSMPDYEPMEEDRMSSGGSEPYNRLHEKGGEQAAMTPSEAHSHYDHFEGVSAYQALHQEIRDRQTQRQYLADNYSHI